MTHMQKSRVKQHVLAPEREREEFQAFSSVWIMQEWSLSRPTRQGDTDQAWQPPASTLPTAVDPLRTSLKRGLYNHTMFQRRS